MLLIVTAVLALSSAYSLAAINQVYNIDFAWYSQLNESYENKIRDVSRDRSVLQPEKPDMGFLVIDTPESLKTARDKYSAGLEYIAPEDLNDNIYIYCTLGKTDSPEYRIKVAEIAQRGSDVEVRLSINTPEKDSLGGENKETLYKPEDAVRIKKSAFPSKGRLYVIFKNQDGKQLGEQYITVK